MRIIKNLYDEKTKFGDTNNTFVLNLYDDNNLVFLNDKKTSINIANKSGLVLHKELTNVDFQNINIDFSDEDLSKLTPDTYLLEVVLALSDGTIAKYPTSGGLQFTITNSLSETTGKIVPTITFDEVLKSVDEKINEYTATIVKGDKGDTGSSALPVAGVYPTLADLIKDNPDKGRVYITTDNGNWNYWNGTTWVAGGVYQASGNNIVSGEIKYANPNVAPFNDLDTLPLNKIVTYGTSDIKSVANIPKSLNSYINGATVYTLSNDSNLAGSVQYFVGDDNVIYSRIAWGYPAHYSEWKTVTLGGKMVIAQTGTPYDDLNTFPMNQTVVIAETPSTISAFKHLPPISSSVGGLNVTSHSWSDHSNGGVQIAIDNDNVMYHRICWGTDGQWGAWKSDSINNLSNNPLSNYYSGSFNDLPLGTVFADATNMTDGPDTSHGFTTTTFYSSQWNGRKAQTAIADNANLMYFRVGGYFGIGATEMSWNSWVLLSDDSKVVHKVDENSNNMILPTLSLFQKVGVVGDSYASGELAFDGNYVDHYEISWLQILARKNGFTGTNFSKGGMSTRTWLTNPNCMPLMQSSDAQELYILALGINDEALGTSYIGNEADIDNGADTFYGNYGKIIKAIQAKAPQAKLVIATIADNKDTAAKFNEAITTIASHFTIPVIVQLDDPLFNSSFYNDNMIGGHPTGPVYSSMALAYERMISKVMYTRYDYFSTYKK